MVRLAGEVWVLIYLAEEKAAAGRGSTAVGLSDLCLFRYHSIIGCIHGSMVFPNALYDNSAPSNPNPVEYHCRFNKNTRRQ